MQGRLSRTVVNLIKVIIHPTVDLSPGHASIAIHQALVYIIKCHVWTLLPTNQLNMTKRWSQCHNVFVIVSLLLCYYNFSFSYSILHSQYSKQCKWWLPNRHESKSYQTDVTYVIYQLKKLKAVILIPPKLELFHKTLFIVQQQIFTLHVYNVYLQTIKHMQWKVLSATKNLLCIPSSVCSS